MGLVPTIIDDGFVLWESNACVRYLARKHGYGTLYPAEPQVLADAERWMDWAHTLTFTMSPMFWGLVRTPPEKRDLALIEDRRREVASLLAILDANLKNRPYVVGDRLTIGDIPFAAHVYRWFNLDLERPPLPHLRAWYERLTEREASRRWIMIPVTSVRRPQPALRAPLARARGRKESPLLLSRSAEKGIPFLWSGEGKGWGAAFPLAHEVRREGFLP